MLALRVSAALMGLVAVGFGAPTPFVASHLLREHKLPTFMGMFPMYGGPLYGRVSQPTFVVSLAVFAALSAVELFCAWLLFNGERLGATLTLAILPLEIAFWIGFALPIPPVLALARLILLVVGWAALRR